MIFHHAPSDIQLRTLSVTHRAIIPNRPCGHHLKRIGRILGATFTQLYSLPVPVASYLQPSLKHYIPALNSTASSST